MSESVTEDLIDAEYLPVYEFREDDGPLGSVVCNVPTADQIDALRTVADDGAIEPDGWFKGYSGGSLPVVDGVPLAILGQRRPVSARTEGVETSQWYNVDDLSVRVDKAFAHPENVSKITVENRSEEA